jgi:hypothetical protein
LRAASEARGLSRRARTETHRMTREKFTGGGCGRAQGCAKKKIGKTSRV